MGDRVGKPKPKTSLQTAEDQRHAMDIVEKLTVLAQPHRRGDLGDMTDTLGKFVCSENCGRGCYDAGQCYALKLSRLRRIKGVPANVLLWDDAPPSGEEIDAATIAEWEEEIKGCENAMKCSGLSGFQAARALIVEDIEPPEWLRGPVRRALQQLAIYLCINAGDY